ncbi:unnamed protein product [Aphanomyces euteiches]
MTTQVQLCLERRGGDALMIAAAAGGTDEVCLREQERKPVHKMTRLDSGKEFVPPQKPKIEDLVEKKVEARSFPSPKGMSKVGGLGISSIRSPSIHGVRAAEYPIQAK